MAIGKKTSSLRTLLRVAPRARVQLTGKRANDTPGLERRAVAEKLLARNRERLSELQYKLYADGRFAVLVVLQAIDGGGKDGTLRKVFTGIDPQGCVVTSFKAPSADELRHDFLWRVHKAVPARGQVGVFNRSHYEDVLIARVDRLVPPAVWRRRYEQINDFERGLAQENVVTIKFLLHISKDEQRRRFEARLADPGKQWKFDPADLEKRKQWDDYRAAFEDAVSKCSTEHAPWYVIPADRKWYRNYAVSQIVCETLEDLPLEWPKPKYDPAAIRLR